MTKSLVLIASFLTSTACLLFTAVPASGLGHETPPTIDEWFDSEALKIVLETSTESVTLEGSGNAEYYRLADAIGEPHEMHRWSAAFLAGKSSDRPTVSLSEWVAPIIAHGETIGVVVAGQDSAGTARFLYYEDRIDLATSLPRLDQNAQVVFDGPSSSWVALEEGLVSPLTAASGIDLADSTSLDSYQPVIKARYESQLQQAARDEISVGGGAPTAAAYGQRDMALIAGSLLMAGGLAAGTTVLISKRRTSRPSSGQSSS